jgi:hypothetical protein
MFAERPKIECDIHALLDEANVMLLMGVSDAEKARDLVSRLRHCADQARTARYDDSEQHLRHAADRVEARLAAIKAQSAASMQPGSA